MLALCALSLALPALGPDDGARLLAASLAAGRGLAASAAPAAPATPTLPAGLREAASAAAGSSDAGFHVRRAGGALLAHGGGLTASFGRAGVTVAAAGGRISLTPVGLGAATPTASGNRVSYRRAGVTEWYVNGPAGLEQGFTVERRPADGRLTITQRLGGLSARQDGQAIVFGSTLRYDGLRAVDAAGRELPARLVLEGALLRLVVDDRSARYPVTIDPLVQQGDKLTAGGSGAQFGWSVGISDTGDTAVIGAPGVGSNSGAAWIFTRTGATWTQAAQLTPTAAEQTPPGRFGAAVAISGDGTTALVGSPSDAGSLGAAWVFRRASPTSWPEEAKLTPNDETGAGLFGASVSLSSDGNTALIGGPDDNAGVGAAWVFAFSPFNGGWQQFSKLTGSGETSAGEFGSSVALSGDALTAVIGAPLDDANDNGGEAGSAFIFLGTDGWFQIGFLRPATGEEDNTGHFGASVAIANDGNTVLVGAPNEASKAGAAWVFIPSPGNGWAAPTEVVKLTPSDETGAGSFGFSVALASDGKTALVGGPDDNAGVGAAWLFTNPGAGWAQQGSKLTANDEAGAGAFGVSAALSQDGSTGIVGGKDDNGSAGAAWPFDHPPSVSGEFADNVSDIDARLNGSVDPNGADTTVVIEYGTSTSYGQTTSSVGLSAAAGAQVVSQTVSGLQPSTTYHFRVDATNSNGTTRGPDQTFVTSNQLSGTAGSQVSGVVATGSGCPTSATIDWGDNTAPTPGTIQCPPGAVPTFSVSGTHTYAAAGHYAIVVTANSTTYRAGAQIASPAAPSPAPTAPTIAGQSAPSVGPESATVAASVNPNGSATTVFVRYGTTAAYGQQTAAVAIGAGSTLQVVMQTLTGLTPSTTYHFQFVATNAGGQTAGPDSTFTTAVPGGSSQQPPPGPVQGVSANVFPLVGTVLVNGQPLVVGQQIPLGSTIDARNGTVLIRVVVNGVVQEMQFAGGIFQLLQLPNGTVQLLLTGGDFSICKAKPKKKGVRVTGSASRADNARTVRMLWGNGKGSFQTKGRYAAATVRGTIYQVADRCDGTFTRVRQGTVSVQDLVLNRTISVAAGRSYLAKAKP